MHKSRGRRRPLDGQPWWRRAHMTRSARCSLGLGARSLRWRTRPSSVWVRILLAARKQILGRGGLADFRASCVRNAGNLEKFSYVVIRKVPRSDYVDSTAPPELDPSGKQNPVDCLIVVFQQQELIGLCMFR